MILPTRSRSRAPLSGARPILALLTLAAAACAGATDYYVSPSGNDANAGTLLAPFATVSKGVVVAQAGDAVIVRGGVYRETVTMPRSGTAGAPITIQAFSGEVPVISGTDVVTGWTGSGANVAANPGWTMGEGADQIFVDGKPQMEARWPNAASVIRPKFTVSSAPLTGTPFGLGTQVVITDPNLTQPLGYWVGSRINLTEDYGNCLQSGVVVASAPGTLTYVSYVPLLGRVNIAPCRYFLTGSAAAQDQPGEWYNDAGSLTLKPTFADAASLHTIEVKRRTVGLDLSGRSNLRIYDLGFFGCSVRGANVSNVVLNRLRSNYGGHLLKINNYFTDGEPAISLNGDANQVRSCVVENTSASGITTKGTNGQVYNCQVHDADYAGSNHGGITIEGTGMSVTDNTVYNVGRFGISVYNTQASQILRNEIYYFGLQTHDLGGIYAFGTDGQGTEIAYNVAHDATTGGAGANGILLDNGCSNFVVHHNLAYNTEVGFHVNPPATNITVAHNTANATQTGYHFWVTGTYTNVKVQNCLSQGGYDLFQPAVQVSGHLSPALDAKFVNITNRDYRLAAGSPAIDRGIALSGGLSGTVNGAAPDSGALEYGTNLGSFGSYGSFLPGTPPTDLRATPGIFRVNLFWAARYGATSYNIYRSSTSGEGYVQIASGVTGTTFEDTGATPDALNYYVITAVNAAGESGTSNEIGNVANTAVKVQGLMAEYYAAQDPGNSWNGILYATPIYRRVDTTIDFNWAQGSPDPRLNADGFAVVWTGSVTAPVTGTYTFVAKADDKGRLTVDGQKIADTFYDVPNTLANQTGTISLVAGQKYSVKYEYYEGIGASNVQLLWSYPGQAQQVVPATALSPSAGNGLETNYYNNTVGANMNSYAALFNTWANNRVDPNVDFTITGSPLAVVNGQWWGAKFRGQLLAPVDGVYTLQVTSDEGQLVSINGSTILPWVGTGGTRSTTIALTAGRLYDIGVDYANSTGDGSMKLEWAYPGQSMQTLPGTYLFTPLLSNYWGYGAQFFSDGAWKNMERQRVDTAVNYDWTTTPPPAPNMPLTGYSARWTARISNATEGNTVFVLDGVGSAKLWVNGRLWIDRQGAGAFNVTASNALYMRSNVWYDLRLEYAPGTDPGKIHLRWKNAGVTSEIPLDRLRVVWAK